jgi:transcriptional regulator with XRE-family HTH domain
MKYTIVKDYPLRLKMDKKKLTIRKLAEKSGVHFTYISRLLTGKSVASEEIKNKLDNVL